jgi:hypothetical protein
LGEWKDYPDGLPQYLALSELAQHVIGMLERDETDGVRTIFDVVESWLLDGDPYVKEAATVGFLEDIQNIRLHNGYTSPDDFMELLLPETEYWWSKVQDFWVQGKPIVDDRTPR